MNDDPTLTERLRQSAKLLLAGWDAVSDDDLDEAANRLEVLEAQRDAALALHRPVETDYLGGTITPMCWHDTLPWPCATVQALGVTE